MGKYLWKAKHFSLYFKVYLLLYIHIDLNITKILLLINTP